MLVFGKMIGGLIGLLTLGPIGLVLGLFVGHMFDRALASNFRFASPENLARIQRSFFETTFLLLGYLAKSDGRISEQEVAHTEQVISNMGLSGAQRSEAIALFKRGAAAEFYPQAAVSGFLETCGRQPQLQQAMLLFLVGLVLADHQIDRAEHQALTRIAGLMGYGEAQLEQLLRMAQAQSRFHGGSRSAGPEAAKDRFAEACTALGVDANVDQKTLKRAYRKLMSENHPDKLIAKGVPEDMIKLATERSQEIQSAYEVVCEGRGFRH
ncbi:co-chaperone DjlA [Haliea sp. E17]|uniref:co-chaperone DjlA n=1 Tax=Haliea sp. E17 TaxID=3401576 RepID=UPI003AAC5E5C